ncbi:MAG: TetR/AcrR family transcriptional regulator [Burkholderiales bacterium]|nr:TetR/AcrR family transcriptional regulator [Burkholderiales bacterium]
MKSSLPDPAAPGRRERRRAATLDHVARTGTRLFEAQGFEATTMEQIAAAADVAKGTLYNHFPTKEAVLAHGMHLTLADDAAQLRALLERPGSFEEKLTRLFAASAQWAEAYRAWLPPYFRHRFLHIDSEVGAVRGQVPRDLVAVYAGLIGDAQEGGTLRTDLDAEHLATLLHQLYFGALMRWLTVPGRALGDEFAAAIELFVRGAAAHGRRPR